MSKPIPSSEPTPPTEPRRKITPLGVVGIGCGVIVGFLLLVIGVGTVMLNTERDKPLNTAAEVAALDGVPVYPQAKIDEEMTRSARVTRLFRGLTPASNMTAVGFRTPDTPVKVLPFYDTQMAGLGFTKTQLGGAGKAGASYVMGATTVVVQMNPESGEDWRLVVMRLDAGAKAPLGKRDDTVSPEDFKKVMPVGGKVPQNKKKTEPE